MLGPPKPRRLDEPVTVSLEALVPPDHFYRHLEATLDLGFVREWVRDRYAERGRPGIDPVVFFKLQLIMFFDGIRSERQLIETATGSSRRRGLGGPSIGALLGADGGRAARQTAGLYSRNAPQGRKPSRA